MRLGAERLIYPPISILILLLVAGISNAGVIPGCQPLSNSSETYLLNADTSTTDDCFTFMESNITLDCQGHTITGDGEDSFAIAVSKSDITIKNCNAMNFTYGAYFSVVDNSIIQYNNITFTTEGLHLIVVNNLTASDNIINKSTSYGIYSEKSTANEFSRNNITNFFKGVYFKESNSSYILADTIMGNSTTGLTVGIYLESSYANVISQGTVVANSETDIYFDYTSSDNLVANSTVANSSNGIMLDRSSTNITIRNNTIYNNTNGVYLKSSSDLTTILENLIDRGTNGVYITNSNHTNVSFNTIRNYSSGIYAATYTANTTVFNNTISNNTYGVYFLNSTDNTITNNSMSSNRNGIFLHRASSNNFIANNTITSSLSNGTYVWTDQPCPTLIRANNNSFINNIISDSADYNMMFATGAPSGTCTSGGEIANLTIRSNNISGSKTGIYFISRTKGIYNITVSENIINRTTVSPGYAIYYQCSSGIAQQNITFTDNNITNSSSWGLFFNGCAYSNLSISNNNFTSTNGGLYFSPGSISSSYVSSNIFTRSPSSGGITMSTASYSSFTISDNIIANNTGDGYSGSGQNIMFRNNTVYNNSRGLYVYRDNNIQGMTITENNFTKNRDAGLYLEGTITNANISNNYIANNTNYGIHIRAGVSADRAIISENRIENNPIGIRMNSRRGDWACGGCCYYTGTSVNFARVLNNNISNSAISALEITADCAGGGVQGCGGSSCEVRNNTISGNIITNSGNGTYLVWAMYSNFTSNTIRNTTYGFQVSTTTAYNNISGNWIENNTYGYRSACADCSNTIYNNYFNNTNNAYATGYDTWNIRKTVGINILGWPYLGGNFWSNYTGSDTNQDGIGDTSLPHTSSGGIVNGGDEYPLIPVSYSNISGCANITSSGIYSLAQNTYVQFASPASCIVVNASDVIVDCAETMIYAQGNLTPDMLSYWRFDEGTGTAAYDTMGVGNATLQNGTAWSSGRAGNAASFDGNDDMVDAGSAGELNGSFTIEMWVKRTASFPARIVSFISRRNGSSINYQLYYNTNGNLYVNSNGSEFSLGSANNILPLNEWVHLAIVRNGTSGTLYRNGIQNATGTLGSGSGVGNQTLTIGAATNISQSTPPAAIDEVALYNRTLSLAELRQHYLSGLDGSGYYQSNPPGSIGVYTDASNVTVRNCIIKDFETGVFLNDTATNSLIKSNTIENNTVGLNTSGSSGNLIYDNLFNNTLNAYATGTNNWNTTKVRGFNRAGGIWFGGNWWHNHSNVDADGDGIADSIYDISSGNVDYLPMVKMSIIFFDGCATISTPGTYVLLKNATSTATCFTVNTNNVIIDCSGYKLEGTKTSSYHGIYASGRTNVTVKNCIITKFDRGVYMPSGATNNRVQDSGISNILNYAIEISGSGSGNVVTRVNVTNATGLGIYLQGVSSNTISGCNATNTSQGMQLSDSSSNTISGNYVSNNTNGINIGGNSQSQTISNNTMYNNTMGINVNTGSIQNTRIQYNNITRNKDAGIYLDGNMAGVDISSNNISYNTNYGINQNQGSETSGPTIQNNTVENNPAGIRIVSRVGGGCSGGCGSFTCPTAIYRAKIINNNISRSSGNALEVSAACPTRSVCCGCSPSCSSYNNTVSGNNITDSGTGIYMSRTIYGNFISNIIRNTTYGFQVSTVASYNNISSNRIENSTYGYNSACTDCSNTIYNNYFNNTNNAYATGYDTWNIRKTGGTNILGWVILGGNFWSNYAGSDTDQDGIGDTAVPFTSGGGIQIGGDEYPLAQIPYSNISNCTDISSPGIYAVQQSLVSNSSSCLSIEAQDVILDCGDKLVCNQVNSTPGMKAYWMGEGNASDYLGTKNGTLSGNATANASGKVGQAFGFDGNGDYINTTASVSSQAEGAIEAWVYISGLGTAVGTPSTRVVSDSWVELGFNDTYSPRFLFYNGSTQYDVLGSAVLSTNTWYHLAGTWGRSGVLLYVNGELVGKDSRPTASGNSATNLWIGGRPPGNSNFRWLYGGIDEVAVYSRAISQCEILQHYNSGLWNESYIKPNIPDSIGVYANSSNTSIRNCIINNFWTGIFLNDTASGSLIKSNTIENNTVGINASASSGNLIYDNLFNNTLNAYATGTNNWNTTKVRGFNRAGGIWYGGNWWHNLTGTDADGDGIFDSPYTLSAGNVDYLPLTKISITFQDSCGTISSQGRYTLIKDVVTSVNTCFTVSTSNVTLDCNGYKITGARTGGTYGVSISGNNVTVKNCVIRGFERGISISSSNSHSILNNNISSMSSIGIYFTSTSSSTISGNFINDSAGNISTPIYLDGSQNNVISSNIISNAIDNGIYLTGNSYTTTISNNTIYNNTNGISTNQGNIQNSVIQNNNFTSNRNAGFLSDVAILTNVNISRNNFLNNTNYGIHVYQGGICGSTFYTENLIISENTMRYNPTGIRVNSRHGDWCCAGCCCWNAATLVSKTKILNNNISYSTSMALEVSTGCTPSGYSTCETQNHTISGNLIINNTNGVKFNRMIYSNFTNNTVRNSTYAVQIDGASVTNVYSGNTIENNTYGIKVSGPATSSNFSENIIRDNQVGINISDTATIANTIYNNYFNNTINARDVASNSWSIKKTLGLNIFGWPYKGGNFWSDYTGSDTDRDGIGDTGVPFNSSNGILMGDEAPLVIIQYTNITGCASITSPGIYALTQNANLSSGTCISIEASDVLLECGEKFINGTNAAGSIGVYINASNVTVRDCGIKKFETGVFLNDTATSSLIKSNTIESNTVGLNASGSSGNLIYDNLFNNTLNAYATGTNDWNTTKVRGFNRAGGIWFGGNWWHNVTGADADDDGIYDSNYTISSGNVDYLPIIKVSITFIDSCGVLSSPGRYVMIKNLPVSPSTCLTMASDGINLDCSGYSIVGVRNPSTYGITATGRNHIKIRNCIVSDFENDIYFSGGSTNRTVIDSNLTNANAGMYITNAGQNVLVSALNIKNTSVGVVITGSDYNNVTNCNITNSTTGVGLSGGADYNKVLYNNISNNSGGINFEVSSQYNLVQGNIIYSNRQDGINFTGCGGGVVTDNLVVNNTIEKNTGSGILITCSNCIVQPANVWRCGGYNPSFGGYTIANNTFRDNGGYGINFGGVGYGAYTKGSTIINNTIYNNTGGVGISMGGGGGTNSNITQNIITMQQDGIYVSSASGTRIVNHTIANLTGTAILIEAVSSGKILNNTIFNNSAWGVYLGQSTGCEISGNNITRNAIGINVSDAASSGNYIFNNLFNNTVDAVNFYSTNYWNTTKTNATNIMGKPFIGGNFWSGYSGADNDGDRIGDTGLPYTVQGRIANGGDYLPLVEKREIISCMDLSTLNETYYIGTDIVYPNSCFDINESNVTLDGGAGQLSIIGNNSIDTIGISISQTAAVRNIKITKYETGVLVNASNVTLSNLHITNSSTGVIVLSDATNLTFTGNKIEGGTAGLNVSGNGSIFYNNYFKTSVNVDDTGVNGWNTSCVCSPAVVSDRVLNGSCTLSPTSISNIVGGPCIGGNYWSDYNGTDVDGDGIGDTNLPYKGTHSIGEGGDELPLVEYLPVTNCTQVNQSNKNYFVMNNLTDNTSTCLDIVAENVTLNCFNKYIIGNATPGSFGIRVNSTNVTIINCVVINWTNGIYFNTSSIGRLVRDKAIANTYGLVLNSSSDIMTNDSVISDSGSADFLSVGGSANRLSNVTFNSSSYPTSISLAYSGDFQVHSSASQPDGNRSFNISKYIDITALTPGAWAYMNISYATGEIPAGMDENSLRIYKWTGAEWIFANTTTATNGVDTVNKRVYAYITAFSTFASMTLPICGNSVVDTGEECDPGPPLDLNNSQCSDVLPGYTGVLACNSTCGFNTSGCTLVTGGMPSLSITATAGCDGEFILMNITESSGLPAANARVHITKDAISEYINTDSSGQAAYRAPQGISGSYLLTASEEGFNDASTSVIIMMCAQTYSYNTQSSLSCMGQGACRLLIDITKSGTTSPSVDISKISGLVTDVAVTANSRAVPFLKSATRIDITSMAADLFTIDANTTLSTSVESSSDDNLTLSIINSGGDSFAGGDGASSGDTQGITVEYPSLAFNISGHVPESKEFLGVYYTPDGGARSEVSFLYSNDTGMLRVVDIVLIRSALSSNELYIEFSYPVVAECTDGQMRPCYTGPMETTGIGLCRNGVQTCTNGSWEETCPMQVLPSSETCGNAIDEDCSGSDSQCPGCISDSECESGMCMGGTCISPYYTTRSIAPGAIINETIDTPLPEELLKLFGIATEAGIKTCTIGLGCSVTEDCYDARCLDSTCACCIETCARSADCCVGYCEKNRCKLPPRMLPFVVGKNAFSGCAGLIQECRPSDQGCISICNAMTILLAIVGAGTLYAFWKYYKSPAVAFIALIIPVAVSLVTYPFAGIIVALLMIGMLFAK